jgi:nucleoside-diphosphate-sugar epimerase
MLAGRDFDAAVDFAGFTGQDAQGAIEALSGHTGHYVFINSGQVYLVLDGQAQPDRVPLAEESYRGVLLAEPETHPHRAEWRYGVGKREAEDIFAAAFAATGFPYTALRLPMVEGEGGGIRPGG